MGFKLNPYNHNTVGRKSKQYVNCEDRTCRAYDMDSFDTGRPQAIAMFTVHGAFMAPSANQVLLICSNLKLHEYDLLLVHGLYLTDYSFTPQP